MLSPEQRARWRQEWLGHIDAELERRQAARATESQVEAAREELLRIYAGMEERLRGTDRWDMIGRALQAMGIKVESE